MLLRLVVSDENGDIIDIYEREYEKTKAGKPVNGVMNILDRAEKFFNHGYICNIELR